MYVIYPADELILFTYGNINIIPKHRPTLDHLQNPRVPIRSLRPIPHDRISVSSVVAQPQLPTRDSVLSTNVQARQSRNDEESWNSRSGSIYPLGSRESNSCVSSGKTNKQKDESKSCFAHSSQTSEAPKSSKSKLKQALPNLSINSRFHKLGQNVPKSSESSRFIEQTHFKVSNPTFTRQNLCERNYDAFFTSGQPIVSEVDLGDEIQTKPYIFGEGIDVRLDRSSRETYSQPTCRPEPSFPDPLSKPPKPIRTSQESIPSPNRTLKELNSGSKSSSISGGVFSFPNSTSGKAHSRAELLTSKSLNDQNFLHYTTSFDRETEQRPPKKRFSLGFLRGRSGQRQNKNIGAMAGPGAAGGVMRELVNAAYSEPIKAHNNRTFRLVKTVSDFMESLAQLYEAHAEGMQTLVSNYRKKNGDLRKDKGTNQSSIFHAWEGFLQEVEADSQGCSDIASALSRQVSRPLLEKSFHRKVQSKKIFTHRECYEEIITRTEEKLSKIRIEYKASYANYSANPTQENLTLYYDAHNNYVKQLHATNAMIEYYYVHSLPQLLQELEDIYCDLCTTVTDGLVQGTEIISSRAGEQSKRYDTLCGQCRSVSAVADLQSMCKSLGTGSSSKIPRKIFAPPQPPVTDIEEGKVGSTDNLPPALRNEFVTEGTTMQFQEIFQQLKKDSNDLQGQIKYLQDNIDHLIRTHSRAVESQLYNKVNEVQEALSMKMFDLRTKQMHLASVNAQKELFQGKVDGGSDERKMSTASGGSMKSKWLKAFRSLKPTTTQSERKTANDVDNFTHSLQEYTYKKITPCDVCSEVLRGHTRQGLRCRTCKANTHVDCASKLPRCQTKARLLRRQRSTSEMEPVQDEQSSHPKFLPRQLSHREPYEIESPEVDIIYQVLKQAVEISSKQPDKASMRPVVSSNGQDKATCQPNVVPPPHRTTDKSVDIPTVRIPTEGQRSQPGRTDDSVRTQDGLREPDCPERGLNSGYIKRVAVGQRSTQSSSLTVSNVTVDSSSSAPHSPRRHKLDLRMKSLSLDSPESSEFHAQRRKITPPSNNSRVNSPSSPSHSKRLLGARGLRTGSVDLPDQEPDRSLSSASTSPCPSPKPHRLLPTNLYAVLYNFQARHQDELDLRAGYKVTVIDSSDPDWWKGKCLGRVGYFPSKYCTKLQAGEKVLQVTQTIQSTERDGLTLLRDQIVVQMGEDTKGLVSVRAADQRTGVCPAKYLVEV